MWKETAQIFEMHRSLTFVVYLRWNILAKISITSYSKVWLSKYLAVSQFEDVTKKEITSKQITKEPCQICTGASVSSVEVALFLFCNLRVTAVEIVQCLKIQFFLWMNFLYSWEQTVFKDKNCLFIVRVVNSTKHD